MEDFFFFLNLNTKNEMTFFVVWERYGYIERGDRDRQYS